MAGTTDEPLKGAEMGSGLIMFVAILSLCIVAFLIGKGVASKGLEQMEGTVKSINDTRFSEYKGKVVTGSKVKSAFDSFANDDIAIFVHTLEMGADYYVNGSSAADAKEAEGGVSYSYTWKNGTGAVDATMSLGPVEKKNDPDGEAEAMYVNYGAMFRCADGDEFTAESGKVTYNGDFVANSTGSVIRNDNHTQNNAKANAEYIADSARFNAQVIVNDANEIVGIVFDQRLATN